MEHFFSWPFSVFLFLCRYDQSSRESQSVLIPFSPPVYSGATVVTLFHLLVSLLIRSSFSYLFSDLFRGKRGFKRINTNGENPKKWREDRQAKTESVEGERTVADDESARGEKGSEIRRAEA